MTELLRLIVTRRLALGVLLAAVLLVPAFTAHAAPVAKESGYIAVRVFPDLAGDVDGQSCPGCDGEFNEDDANANADDPLDSLEVVLYDEDEDEIDRKKASISAEDGHLVAFFSELEVGDYKVELDDVPDGWEFCPDSDNSIDVEESSFDRKTNIAFADFFMWRGCTDEDTSTDVVVADTDEDVDEDAAEEADEDVDEEADEDVDEEVDEDVAEEADEDVDEEADEDVDEEADEDVAEEADEDVDEDADEAAEEDVDDEDADTVEVEEDADAATDDVATVGAIRGIVYLDANRNGTLDPDEAGVADVDVTLVGNGLERTARSAGAGTYAFPDLTEGSYDVTVTVPEGHELTTPGQHLGVAVAGDMLMGIDFGLVAAEAETGETGTTDAAASTSETEDTSEPGTMPETGVQMRSRSSLLLGLAAIIGVLGVVGLALESRHGRRSFLARKGQQ